MSTYKDIFKSSGLVAFVQVFQMVFALIRNKAAALLIGAGGFGVWGILQAFNDMISSFALLGVDQSGVRDIAKHRDDRESVGKILWIFRRLILLTSVSVGIVIVVLAESLSNYLFDGPGYTSTIRICSIVVILNGFWKLGYAMLNGVRDLKKLATSQIVSAIAGSVLSIAILSIWRYDGIPYALLAIAASLSFSTLYFAKKLNLSEIRPDRQTIRILARSLIAVGLGFSVAAMVSAAMTFLSRGYLSANYELSAVGIYQASWTVSNLYIGIILSAMGVEFMPRLMKVCSDDRQMNELVNQQQEFGMVAALIGVVGILTFAPLLLKLLYSSEFIPGTTIIRWQVLGVAMRILAFPYGYVIMAKHKPAMYATIQTIFWVGEYFLLILFSSRFGFDGLGVNYFVGYFCYLMMGYLCCARLTGYKPSAQVLKVLPVYIIFIGVTWFATRMLPEAYAFFAGSIIMVLAGSWAYRHMQKHMGIDLWAILKTKIKK